LLGVDEMVSGPHFGLQRALVEVVLGTLDVAFQILSAEEVSAKKMAVSIDRIGHSLSLRQVSASPDCSMISFLRSSFLLGLTISGN
jgi:hypothetical protein